MQKAEYSVRSLIDKIERGELRLPEMQRGYVWRATRVRDLMDSLYRGYPSGVILAWETDDTIETRDFAVASEGSPVQNPLLLLDGQQRLTSLAAVIRGKPVHVRGRKRPIELLFNLDHPDELKLVGDVDESSDEDTLAAEDETAVDIQKRWESMTFVVSSKQLEAKANWVRVADIFTRTDGELLLEAGVTSFEDERFGRYSERLQAVRAIADYVYRMDILERSKSYEEVTEIFVRVNSLGAKLRSSDLALAQITARWKGALDRFMTYQSEVDKRGFDLDLGFYLRTLVAMITGQSKFQTVHSISLTKLEDGWERATKAIDHTLNYVTTNLGIDSPVLLSSPSLLVTTAFWADRHEYSFDAETSARFRQWFLMANAKGRYSRGSMETLLDQDLFSIHSGGGAESLIRRLRGQVGRLDFTAEELAGRTSRSGAFKTLFLAFRQDGAADWTSDLRISPKHHGRSDKVEYHHVFPKALMKKKRPGMDQKLVNDMANLAFIGSGTNKRISDRSPEDYRHDFEEARLRAQLVDFSAGATADDFEGFVELRRERIAERLNRFLGLDEDFPPER